MAKRRYAQVGLGGRSLMYSRAVAETFNDRCEMVGLCDINPGRLEQRVEWFAERGSVVPGFEAEAFDRMIAETQPDVVIVTSKDGTHDQYIVRAMELGCDVVTEKPMTIDEQKCTRIIETQRRTGRRCTVTFNYRYSPPRTQVKDLLMSGVIGDVRSVDFHWMLDTHHGADYYRRWHRNKANSGGLMVHKATHHFDLVNWWLSAVPVSVYALGERSFYTPQTAARYGLNARGERCLDCPEASRCPFAIDLRGNPGLSEMYLRNESYDGYYRDRCVFSDAIDIEDSMQMVVAYDSGARMSYSLTSYAPWEGYEIAFNGTKGRLEHKCQETVYINGDGSVPGELLAEGTTIKVFPHFGAPYALPIWSAEGGHGGGDAPLLEDVFAPKGDDPYLRAADHRSGAYSILTGVAANRSMASGQAVRIDGLVQGIGYPDYTAMPSPDAPMALGDPAARRLTEAEAEAMRDAEG